LEILNFIGHFSRIHRPNINFGWSGKNWGTTRLRKAECRKKVQSVGSFGVRVRRSLCPALHITGPARRGRPQDFAVGNARVWIS
jgi:hypothetical protein